MGKGFKCGSGNGSGSGSVSAGGMTMELLWENASSASGFGADTVSLDLTGYDLVAIRYQYGTGSDAQIQYFQFGTVGATIGLDSFGNATTVRRRHATIKTTGVTFGSGYNGSNSISAANIPIAIYGINGVTM